MKEFCGKLTVIEGGRHARASAMRRNGTRRLDKGRECIEASPANVTPRIARVRADVTSATQYSEGMRPRCPHLRIAATEAPMSAARSSSVGQEPSSAFGVVSIPIRLGPIVLKVKANMSHDIAGPFRDVGAMAKEARTEFEAEFKARTKEARETKGLTQVQMATALGMDQGKYKQYETRSVLPHEYIEQFLLITGRNYEWLFTGRARITQAAPGRRRSAA